MAAAVEALREAGSTPFPKKGEHYVPLVNETKEGHVYSHALQTILVEPQALYNSWRDVSTIPLWQEHVVSVTAIDDHTSHWVMGDPEDADGKRIEFDSRVIDDEPGRRIAWASITPGVELEGSVTFTPHPSGRGTVVSLKQVAKVPGGMLGNAVAATAKRSPTQTVIENLRHFKEMAEAGAIPSVKGQPHGPRGVTGAIKEWMFGEKNPTPPGTSNLA